MKRAKSYYYYLAVYVMWTSLTLTKTTHPYTIPMRCGIPSLNWPTESVAEEIWDNFKIPALHFKLLYQITVCCIDYGKLEMLTGSQSITLLNKLKLKSKTTIVYYWASADKQMMHTVLVNVYERKRYQKRFHAGRHCYGAILQDISVIADKWTTDCIC